MEVLNDVLIGYFILVFRMFCCPLFFYFFQKNVLKGLFLEYHHNGQIIPHYVRSDLGISHLQMLSA